MTDSPPTAPTARLVMPCYNEAARLRPDDVEALLADPRVALVCVDDGSQDATLSLLEELAAAHAPRVVVHALPSNQGKAEAVRQGLRVALEAEPHVEVTGYLDADFATPAAELHRLLDELFAAQPRGVRVAMGARVARLGADIRRSPRRHYLGRLFASAASVILGLAVYDTQCGAKLFARSPRLDAALVTPFRSRWIFDVELIGRLSGTVPLGDPALDATAPAPLGPDAFLEVPLRQWTDVAGSKLGAKAMARAGAELARLGVESLR